MNEESPSLSTESSEPLINPHAKSMSKKEHVTMEQKILMVNYIFENAEMITHSSTKENEKHLWEELERKLNTLKPAKPLASWKNFWQRWQATIFSKPESSLRPLDSKLKNFLIKITTNTVNDENTVKKTKKFAAAPKKRVTIDEIKNTIDKIEREKSKLNFEVDDNDLKILQYKKTLKWLENENVEKRKRIKKLNERKVYLNTKRKKYEEKKETSILIN